MIAKSKLPEYMAWVLMKKRCYNKKFNRYHRYGGRGISVASEWLNDFDRFLSDMGPRPTPEHSLDRIDNDGNYEPSNCRWATDKDQNRNTSASRIIEFNGERKSLAEWAERYGLKQRTLLSRLDRGKEPVSALLFRTARKLRTRLEVGG